MIMLISVYFSNDYNENMDDEDDKDDDEDRRTNTFSLYIIYKWNKMVFNLKLKFNWNVLIKPSVSWYKRKFIFFTAV